VTVILSSPPEEEEKVMKQGRFPVGWNEERTRRVLAHYEQQTEEEAVTEDEAAFEDHNETVMQKKLASDGDLEAGYELMAQDKAREEEAIEWIEGALGKIATH
jgi:hypothetical protein